MRSYLIQVQHNARGIHCIRVWAPRIRRPVLDVSICKTLDPLRGYTLLHTFQIVDRHLIHREPTDQRSDDEHDQPRRSQRHHSDQADRQIVPTNAQAAPPGTPIRANGPIKHVFYIVRENRTYDQVFGSDPRGDGDPKLELFDDNGVPAPLGGVTPNAHRLAHVFPLLDHFYAELSRTK